MAERSGRTRFFNVAVFIGLEVASLCLLASGSAVRQLWLGRGFTTLQAHLWENADKLRLYTSLREENTRLLEENAHLLYKALNKNTSYNGLDSLWQKTRSHFCVLPTNIITMTFTSQHNYLILDRGSEDGVHTDDGVITSRGVIGIVAGVSRHFCYAVSYLNTDMTLSVRHGKSGVAGSMTWDGMHSNLSVLGGIPLHIAVSPGDTIFTSGFSSIFPPDIPIGLSGSVRGNNGSTSEYSVSLLEDFRKISHVMIVRNLDREEIKGLGK